MKVLWLCSWYPNKIRPFNGDFVKRHAEAVSLYAEVHVLHVVRDVKAQVTNDVYEEGKVQGRLKETIIYYHTRKHLFRFLEKIISGRKYLQLGKKAIRKIMDENGKPDLIHVYIGMKMGLLGLWLSKKYKIPYVVTEQWTGLLPEAIDNLSEQSNFIQMQWKKLLKKSARVIAVSDFLAEALRKRFKISKPVVIPNVVNTEIFYPGDFRKAWPEKFIHISTLDSFKNPDLILQAFAKLIKTIPSARLMIFAPEKNWMIKRCEELKIINNLSFHKEVPQPELVSYVRSSDALVLYSAYETFGCVIIEANACGLPVIVSDIPVMRELVTNKENGLLASPGNPTALAEVMKKFCEVKQLFDKEKIAQQARDKFNYSRIGMEFFRVYQSVLTEA